MKNRNYSVLDLNGSEVAFQPIYVFFFSFPFFFLISIKVFSKIKK